MKLQNSFYSLFRSKSRALLLALGMMCLCSCGGSKQQEAADEQALSASDDPEGELDVDTLVYDVPDAPLTEAVDENFIDFLYTFINRSGFKQQRAAYPVKVFSASGDVETTLTNGRSVSDAVVLPDYDYFVMLMDEHDDPYDYMDRANEHAELHLIQLQQFNMLTYVFDKQQGQWNFTSIRKRDHDQYDGFLHFYLHFASDETFRHDHLANEIKISIPDDESMEMIEGNIDASQWDVFAPELPTGSLLILDLDAAEREGQGLKLVKCGVSTSMMEVMTFHRDGEAWKLVRYEE